MLDSDEKVLPASSHKSPRELVANLLSERGKLQNFAIYMVSAIMECGYMRLCAHGVMCTWGYVHMGLCAHGVMCTWGYVHMGLCAHGVMCTWGYVHMGLFAGLNDWLYFAYFSRHDPHLKYLLSSTGRIKCCSRGWY